MIVDIIMSMMLFDAAALCPVAMSFVTSLHLVVPGCRKRPVIEDILSIKYLFVGIELHVVSTLVNAGSSCHPDFLVYYERKVSL